MYGDTSVIRALARSMHERAEDLRAQADHLAGRAATVPWTGLAADAMRRSAEDHAGKLRACAGAHAAAADALDRHAREVDRLEELIATIERRARHVLEKVAGGVAGLAGHLAVPDDVHDWAAHFDPPSPGSRAWLGVHLPRCA